MARQMPVPFQRGIQKHCSRLYTMESYGGIGVSSMPKARLAVMSRRGYSLNVMVAGAHGLGKTTLLGQLFGITKLKKSPFPPRGGNKFWYNEDVCNIQTSVVEISESDFSMRLTLTEVDNIGDCSNNAECHLPIAELLQENFRDYEEQFSGGTRAAMSDRRIHVCFYMLEPLEQIRAVDIEAMRAISRFCSIVPVVAKSDLVPSDRTEAMRAAMRDQLDANSIGVFDDKQAGCEAPFFVILGEVEDGALARERCYPWGIVELDRLPQNEFYRMQEFIIQRSIVGLKNETEFYYDNYRTSKLASYLVEVGKSDENKALMQRLEEHRGEIRDVKARIKQRRHEQPCGNRKSGDLEIK